MADPEVADDPADGEPLGDEPPEEAQTGGTQGSQARWHQTVPESVARVAVIGLVVVLGLGVLCGWLGYRIHSQGRAEQDRALFLEVGKQADVALLQLDGLAFLTYEFGWNPVRKVFKAGRLVHDRAGTAIG